MTLAVFTFAEEPFARIPGESTGTFGVVKTYASTTGYTSEPGDNPGNTHFEGRIEVPLQFERSIVGQGGFGGQASVGFGVLELANTDGFYDDIVNDGATDGRRIVIKIGADEYRYDQFGVIFDGTSSGMEGTENSVRVRLRDLNYLLARPLQNNVYGGTGGLDGNLDIKGNVKPLCFGRCLNIAPVLVNPTGLVYQFNDGPSQAVNAVYDRGALLSPGSGYTVNLTTSTITLTTAPAGTITADVQGMKSSGVYLSSTASIIDYLLRNNTIVTTDRIDTVSISRCASDSSAEIGIYITEKVNADDTIGALMLGIGGWWGFNRSGKFQIAVFKAPTGNARIEAGEEDITAVERITLPDGIYPPPWRYRVGYQRNWTVQGSDLAGVVTTDRRAFLLEQYRTGSAQDEVITLKHPMSREPDIIPAYFSEQVHADAEAERLLNLYGRTARSMYRVTLKTYPFQLDIGDVVALRYPRWSLREGRNFVVVSVDDDAVTNDITITVFG